MNAQRQKFLDSYLTHGNAARAAREAGYSPRTAKQQGSYLLTCLDVRSALQARQAKAQDAADVTAAHVLAELAKIGLANVREKPKLGHKLRALEALAKFLST